MSEGMRFGAVIVGDEILSGKRQDKHFAKIAEMLGARGLRLCGWVANTVDPAMTHVPATLDALALGLGSAPCLGLVPRLPQATPEAIAPYLNVPALHVLFDSNSVLKETA